MSIVEIQLGKKGLTDNFILELKKRFEKPKVENIKISVLKSGRKNREDVKRYADHLSYVLGNNYTYRIVGFTIFLKKWRKPKNNKTNV